MFLLRLLRLSTWCGAIFAAAAAAAAAYGTEYKVDLIQFEPWAMNNPDSTSKVLYVGIVPDLSRASFTLEDEAGRLTTGDRHGFSADGRPESAAGLRYFDGRPAR